MPRVACYVCNYNGKEYARKCIASVLGQVDTDSDFHLYLVDNASTDGSVESIREEFGAWVSVLCNPVNLGGAGGFNTALKDGIKKAYEYIILLDNDITLADGCVSSMVRYMEEHADTGCVGAKIMMMDQPDYMQEFGVHLDFERYGLIHDYWYELDPGTEEMIESDCLASCALTVRTSCLDETRLFPEENFLYWDDLEFTYQIKLSGYRVVSLASAVAYHKGKKKPGTNTAPGYYGMRNRIKFFSKFEKEDRLPQLCRNILDEYFQFFFGSASKGFHASNSSRMFALDDFVHKKYGKADGQKVYPMDEKADRIKVIAENNRTAYIELPESEDEAALEAVGALCRRLDEIEHMEKVYVLTDAHFQKEAFGLRIKRYYGKELEYSDKSHGGKGLTFRPCGHIKDVTEDIRPVIWVDRYLNCVETQEDYEKIRAYPHLRDFFIKTHYAWLMQGILEERAR